MSLLVFLVVEFSDDVIKLQSVIFKTLVGVSGAKGLFSLFRAAGPLRNFSRRWQSMKRRFELQSCDLPARHARSWKTSCWPSSLPTEDVEIFPEQPLERHIHAIPAVYRRR